MQVVIFRIYIFKYNSWNFNLNHSSSESFPVIETPMSKLLPASVIVASSVTSRFLISW